MFSKVAVFITALFAVSAMASPIESSCNVGTLSCCNSLHAPQSASGVAGIGLINVVVQSLHGDVGLGCSPITGVGLGSGANCNASPVCCEHNNFNQLVGVNCSPITVGA